MLKAIAVLISTLVSFSVPGSVDENNTLAYTQQDHKTTYVSELADQKIQISVNDALDLEKYIPMGAPTEPPTITPLLEINTALENSSPVDITASAIDCAPVLKVVESYQSIMENIATNKDLITDFSSIGAIVVDNSFSNYDSTKVIIKKDAKSYLYTITNDDSPQFFPLQLGSGTYNISLLEGSSKDGYSFIAKDVEISAEIKEYDNVFLLPIQYNSWINNSEFVQLIDQITANSHSEEEIISSIHSYMVDNFSYNYTLAASPPRNYNPDISLLLNQKSGICYDYAAIFSAALRYKGIPTKILKGYTTTIATYHSWNEVYINGSWQTVDVTIDYYNKSNGLPYTIAKDSSNYQTQYYY